jgi:hypothetical protein
MGVKNFGATSLTEVHEKLGGLGLGLRNIEDEGDAAPMPPLSAPTPLAPAPPADAADTAPPTDSDAPVEA